MTKNRDLKDLIRARMKKTGESYTAARAAFLGPNAKHIAPQRQWADIAGIKDATVEQRTGRTWSEWVRALDNARAFEWEHPIIAKYLSTECALSGWWAQSVTVGYERIHGIRDVGQNCDGSFEANKSKTFAVPITDLYKLWAEPKRRRKWLNEGVVKVRNQRNNQSLIIDWDDGTQVNVYFIDKGEKSAAQLQHKKLSAKEDIERRKRFWEARLKRLGDVAG